MPRPKGSLNKKTIAKQKPPRKKGYNLRPKTEEERQAISERAKDRWARRKAALAAGEAVPEWKRTGPVTLIEKREAAKTDEDLMKEAEEIIRKMAYLVQYNLIRTYKPNRAEIRFHYAKNDQGGIPRNRMLQGSNKVGKTTAGVCEDIAHAFGYRPWLEQDDPNYKIDIKVPNNGLVLGETITNSVDKKLVPEIMKWLPAHCQAETRKNPQGVIIKIHLPFNSKGKKCGSTIYLGSYDQPADTQEGIDWAWVHYDEPPPHENYIAIERGKIASDARSWLTMTPLKAAWILDELVEKADTDSDINVVPGLIWDNLNGYYCETCGWYEDFGCVQEQGVERVIDLGSGINWKTKIIRCPDGHEAMFMGGVLTKAAINDYIKKLDPDEYEARILGKWKHLAGLVYGKWWKDEVHVVDDFAMDKCFRMGWTPYEAVDPHDNRDTCWLFAAMGPNDRLYIYDYLLVKGTVEEIVQKVKVKREMHGYATPQLVVLDKKHGQKHNMALAEGKSWQEELENKGIKRIELSDSKPGDVELGHKKVKEWLESKFSTLFNKEMPKMMFFKKGCGGPGGPIYQMKRYSYDDLGEKSEKNPNPKPKDLHKDWPDTVRYLVMKDPKYKDPERKRAANEALKKRYDDFVGVRRRAYGYEEARV